MNFRCVRGQKERAGKIPPVLFARCGFAALALFGVFAAVGKFIKELFACIGLD